MDFTVPSKLKITMIPFTAEYYNSKSIAATPAAEDLLKVNDDAESN